MKDAITSQAVAIMLLAAMGRACRGLDREPTTVELLEQIDALAEKAKTALRSGTIDDVRAELRCLMSAAEQ